MSDVLLLAVDGDSTRIVYHHLVRFWPDLDVILEDSASRVAIIRSRMKRLGVGVVAGQLAFQAGVVPLLRRLSGKRIRSILRDAAVNLAPIPGARRVRSVNSDEARRIIARCAPRVVVVNGTRIIGPETLSCTSAPFLNIHAGITPAYRGVHGGWWALAEGRPELVGTTVHYVDTGIDTGGVIAQRSFGVSPDDTFATLPYLHVLAGLDPLTAAVDAIFRDRKPPEIPPLTEISKLRFHPTVFQYLGARLNGRAR